MKNVYILAVLLSLLFSFQAGAYNVHFVNGTSGSDSYDGMAPHFTAPNHGPKKTIQGAFNTATANDDIYVSNALYNETLTVTVGLTLHNSSNVRLSNLVMNGKDISLLLDGNLNVTNSLTLNKGYIVTDSYSMVIVDYTVSQYGGSKNSFVAGPFGVTANSTSSNINLRFPVGKDTNYRPATLHAVPVGSTNNIFVGEVFNNTPPALCTPPSEGINNVSTVRYWCFYTSCAGIKAATITLAYGSDDGVDTTQTVIIKTDDDSASCWMNICGRINGNDSFGNITSGCRFYALGCFTFGNVNTPTNPLPVTLVKFDAKFITPTVSQLNWSTASEINNHYFTIERTTDPSSDNWITVCRREGHGTSNNMNFYSCNDSTIAEVGSSIVYYRPKQVDYNGTTAYFTIAKLQITLVNETGIQNVYPNPATDRLYIGYKASENTNLQIRLLTTEGKVVLTSKYTAQMGQQNIDLELPSDQLAKGVYVLEVSSDKEVSRHKIYKQ